MSDSPKRSGLSPTRTTTTSTSIISPPTRFGSTKSGVEAAAVAMRKAASEELLTALEEKKPLDSQAFVELYKSLHAESDRALPTIIFAFLDTEMLRHMLAVLNPEISGGLEVLTTLNGPLATAHSRILLAQALRWLPDSLARDITRLRKLRNHFAHDHNASLSDDMALDHIYRNELLESLAQAKHADFPLGPKSTIEVEKSDANPDARSGRTVLTPRISIQVGGAFTTWLTLHTLWLVSTARQLGTEPVFVHGVKMPTSLTDYLAALIEVLHVIFDAEWTSPSK